MAVRSGTAAIRNVGASGEVDAGFRDEKVLLRLCVMAVCKCLQFWASPCLHLREKSWKIIEKGPKIILQAESNQNTSWRKIIRLYAHVCVYIYSSSFNYNDVKVNIKHDLMWFCNRIKQNKQLLKKQIENSYFEDLMHLVHLGLPQIRVQVDSWVVYIE